MNQESTEIKSAAELVPKTLEMLATPKASPIIQPSFDENKLKRWSEKWLRLKTGSHPSLLNLERKVFEFCGDYAKNPSKGRRMLIHGAYGSGKSHTARAIYRWANSIAMKIPLVSDPLHGEDLGIRLTDCEFMHWPAIVDRFKPPHSEWWRIDQSQDISMLIIDDIGAEHDPSRVGIEKLYLILERREWRWTVMTTNVSPEAWEEKFERRIASRFLRNCDLVSVEDVPDYNSL